MPPSKMGGGGHNKLVLLSDSVQKKPSYRIVVLKKCSNCLLVAVNGCLEFIKRYIQWIIPN